MALFGKKTGTTEAQAHPEPTPEPASLAPIVSLIIAEVAVSAGDTLLRRGVERGLLNGKPVPGRVIRGRTFKETVIGTVLAEVARRSVPGAILVGGGLIAKILSDRRKTKRAEAEKSADQS